MSDQELPARSTGIHEFSVHRFTTDALPERQRLSVWREQFGRTLVHVEIEPLSGEAIRAEATLRALPGLRTLSFKGSAMRLIRTQALAAAGDNSVGLIVNRDPAAAISHRNRELTLAYGDACAVLADEPGVFSGRSHLGLVFPRAPLVARVRNIADIAARRIPGETDALRLLTNYLRALPEKLTLDSPKLQRTVISHIYDLATLVICPDRAGDENSRSATAAARLELALSFIRRHFEKPGLTVSAAARDQNISPRYLQRLIETTASTFSAHVNELRLQQARVLLTDPRYRDNRISDIALRAGFSDIAHFNRSFRRRFGDTPSGVRARIGALLDEQH